jgi:hypothetical protein
MNRIFLTIALAFAAVPFLSKAQVETSAATTNAPASAVTNSEPVVEEESEKTWSFTLSAYTYIVPDSREYVQPIVTADRGHLHLEARYNYEDLNTGSLWVGYNLSAGDKVSFEFTPMLGGVFGNTTGVAPGWRLGISWWKLELYSESEYVFDTGDSSNNFFYNWSELTLAPLDWFRFGLAIQRSRLYETDVDVESGLLLGVSVKRLDLTAIVFGLDQDRQTLVFAAAFNF